MELSELEIGTKLELELFDDTGIRLDQTHVSEFEWFAGIQEAIIAAPLFEGNVFHIRIGAMMDVYFIKRRENDINLLKFRAVVKGREISENLHLLRIELRGKIERVQRREYFRLDCSVQVQYRIVDSLNAVHNEDIPYKKTIANNLSGGGISLKLEDMIEVGRLVECEIFTDQSRKIRFFGKVIRYEKSDMEGKFKYEAGIAYIKINNKDREAVVRYIFNEQRKLRKKGLI